LVSLLDRLVDEGSENEPHPLASLTEFGALIEKHQDEHVSELPAEVLCRTSTSASIFLEITYRSKTALLTGETIPFF